jgi:outer membrane protein OmpA-like peptidoglycan-associated protein
MKYFNMNIFGNYNSNFLPYHINNNIDFNKNDTRIYLLNTGDFENLNMNGSDAEKFLTERTKNGNINRDLTMRMFYKILPFGNFSYSSGVNQIDGGTEGWSLENLNAFITKIEFWDITKSPSVLIETQFATTPFFLTNNTKLKLENKKSAIQNLENTINENGYYVYHSGNKKNIDLYNGIILNVDYNSTENKMMTCASKPAYPCEEILDPFILTNTNFKLATTELLPESIQQLTNLVFILKAMPQYKINIFTYSEASGDEDSNIKLTQVRANAIKEKLVELGFEKYKIINVVGYGSKYSSKSLDNIILKAKDRHSAIQLVE